MTSAPKLSKPRYPKPFALQGVDRFNFDHRAQHNNWLGTHTIPRNDDVTEHVLEYRFVLNFIKSLKDVDGRAASRINQKYRAWAGANAYAAYRDTSCSEKIENIIGSIGNPTALCILEAGLNQIKTNIWALNKPIGERQWAGNLSLANYQNRGNVEREFCRVASAIAYMTRRDVFRKIQQAARGIRNELRVFQETYNKCFDTPIDFALAWERSIKAHFESMWRKSRERFIEKFGSFLAKEAHWLQNHDANMHAQIRAEVRRLKTVRRLILRVIDKLENSKDTIFQD